MWELCLYVKVFGSTSQSNYGILGLWFILFLQPLSMFFKLLDQSPIFFASLIWDYVFLRIFSSLINAWNMWWKTWSGKILRNEQVWFFSHCQVVLTLFYVLVIMGIHYLGIWFYLCLEPEIAKNRWLLCSHPQNVCLIWTSTLSKSDVCGTCVFKGHQVIWWYFLLSLHES